VAQAVSIHTARWISQLRDQGWDIHVFDMLGSFPHPELRGITEYSLLFPRRIPYSTEEPSYGHPFFMRHGWDPFPLSLAGFFIRRLFRRRTRRLADLIRRIQPDVIHSMELQTESYHLLDAAAMLGGSLGAPWMVTTWGSDIFHFQRFPEHLDRIKALLRRCDYLIPDCARDEALAREYGFTGVVPFILPGSGGYPIAEMRRLMRAGSVSSRRLIMLKGYEGWAGRALNSLEALEACADDLSPYEIVIYAVSPAILPKLRALQTQVRLRITILQRSPHRTMLQLFGRARLAIGVNSTDGVPNAMLEAMTLGAFPIQSDTQSTSEWITNGLNGLLVDPNDAASIAAAVRRALNDDSLMENAAAFNAQLVLSRLDTSVVKPKVIEMYTMIAKQAHRTSL
jgi:glycosyltransferase involved in cell wall biosynthesis